MPSSLNGTGVSFNDSTSQSSAWIGGRGQIFTSTGTFTVPAGVTAIKVTCIGGGGGGGASTGGYALGGGAAGTAIDFITGLTPGATITATIGSAGSGGVTNGNGASGGTSSFGSYCSATGGAGSATGTGGSGTISIGSGIVYTGGNTGQGTNNPCFGSAKSPGGGTLSSGSYSSGAYSPFFLPAGAGMFGRGGEGYIGGAGAAATGYGNGGQGALLNASGGAGSGGIILVEW